MSFYTAKRFANALQQVVQHHEAADGPLQLDFKKRVREGAQRPDAERD
jgi:hypothetical protein